MSQKIHLSAHKILLSSEGRVYKTEGLIKKAGNFFALDQFLNKLGEGIISSYQKIIKLGGLNFKIETLDKAHSFLISLNKQNKDVIFYRYVGLESLIRKNDNRLNQILNDDFDMLIEPVNHEIGQEFSKLYVLTNASNMIFPLLNEEQKGLVAIEDANVLIQGVAGSGKTNVCIDKLIFTACRGYSGKILYSTYSKGLLLDTQGKLKSVRNNLIEFIDAYQKNRVVFLDSNRKKAIYNRLGIYFSSADDEGAIIEKIKRVADFLNENVDFMLLEDLYAKHIKKIENEIANENYFVKTYIKGIKNHQLTSRLDKVKHLSFEVIYKEIFGLILGCQTQDKTHLSAQEYTFMRQNSFSKTECEVIYALSQDYLRHLNACNLLDNNIISRELIKIADKIKPYSLAIIDEVQDLTQISLELIKTISRKMFCVGDALQMINPSYFSFAFLKRLLFEKDLINVSELSHNYRSTQLIASLTHSLGEINIKQFGTHSFVLKCDTINSNVPTLAAKISRDLLNEAQKQGCNNYTIITATAAQKEELRKEITTAEILTVSQIKGLERDNVILYNVLSSNIDKWKTLQRLTLNRKTADENSVYRYYFNLFYVALSRAKTHVYVYEQNEIELFEPFFNQFSVLTTPEAIKVLLSTSDKTEEEQDKLIDRISEFIGLMQFENARFLASKIINSYERETQLKKADIYENLVFKGQNKLAGIKLWECGLLTEAREQLILANENELVKMIDACTGQGQKELGAGIITFLPEVESNDVAKTLIFNTLTSDLNNLKIKQNDINARLKSILNRS